MHLIADKIYYFLFNNTFDCLLLHNLSILHNLFVDGISPYSSTLVFKHSSLMNLLILLFTTQD